MNFLLTPNRPWKEFTFFLILFIIFFYIHQKSKWKKVAMKGNFYNVLHGVIYETNWFTTFCTVVVKYWNGTQTVNVLKCPFQCIVTKTAFTTQKFLCDGNCSEKYFFLISILSWRRNACAWAIENVENYLLYKVTVMQFS